jgi:hypothetical protein
MRFWRIEDDILKFYSWWCDGDYEETPDNPWEEFWLMANGREVGDMLDDWDRLKESMAKAGLKIVDIKSGEDV